MVMLQNVDWSGTSRKRVMVSVQVHFNGEKRSTLGVRGVAQNHATVVPDRAAHGR